MGIHLLEFSGLFSWNGAERRQARAFSDFL
jgi:hypothetical protein